MAEILADEKKRGAKLKLCDCYHPWSDKTHGKGLRVHNRITDGWRCAVCGQERK